jgi:hypothetical protein
MPVQRPAVGDEPRGIAAAHVQPVERRSPSTAAALGVSGPGVGAVTPWRVAGRQPRHPGLQRTLEGAEHAQAVRR